MFKNKLYPYSGSIYCETVHGLFCSTVLFHNLVVLFLTVLLCVIGLSLFFISWFFCQIHKFSTCLSADLDPGYQRLYRIYRPKDLRPGRFSIHQPQSCKSIKLFFLSQYAKVDLKEIIVVLPPISELFSIT